MPRDTYKLGPGTVLDPLSGGTGIDASDLPAGQTLQSLGNEGGWQAVPAPAASVILQSRYAEYLSAAVIAAVIPADDTIPQIGEGTQILSVTLTPAAIGNRIRARFQGFGNDISANGTITVALFRDAVANALAAAGIFEPSAGSPHTLTIEFQELTTGIVPVTYTIRCGNAGTIAARLSAVGSGRVYGGVARATLIVDELTP